MFEVVKGAILKCRYFEGEVKVLDIIFSRRYLKKIYLVEEISSGETMWVSYSAFIDYVQMSLFDYV